VGEWQSVSKTTDYFNFVHPWEHGCPCFCICIVFHRKFYVFETAWFQSFYNHDRCPFVFCHCSCTLLSCLWHCTPCGRTGHPVSVFLLGGNYKRTLICILHGSLLICCQQLCIALGLLYQHWWWYFLQLSLLALGHDNLLIYSSKQWTQQNCHPAICGLSF